MTMGACSLFGKLQTRRDFVAVGVPRALLSPWEQWLQNSVAASRQQLKDGWIDAFLKAPIWRFWLGSDIFGSTAMGALMPSLDGVGRYFPLAVFAVADDGATFEPPEINAQDAWFDEVEGFLLSTLDNQDHESVLSALARLKAPESRRRDATWPDVSFDPHGVARVALAERSFEKCFELSRGADPDRAYSSSTFWWSLGGEDFPPCALASRRMPSPFAFVGMLTGDFADTDVRHE